MPNSFPERLTKIDALTRVNHHHLRDEDRCFFLGEYSARKGFAHSATNHLIINFKKPMDRKSKPEWTHKLASIRNAAQALHKALSSGDLREMIFVPVPPSKSKTDPLYDDRMLATLTRLSELVQSTNGYRIDIRELVVQNSSTIAAHDGDTRLSPDELSSNYRVSTDLLLNLKSKVVVFDDVLTTGSHFRAVCNALQPHMPEVEFRGLFLARRVPEAIDFSELFGDN